MTGQDAEVLLPGDPKLETSPSHLVLGSPCARVQVGAPSATMKRPASVDLNDERRAKCRRIEGCVMLPLLPLHPVEPTV